MKKYRKMFIVKYRFRYRDVTIKFFQLYGMFENVYNKILRGNNIINIKTLRKRNGKHLEFHPSISLFKTEQTVKARRIILQKFLLCAFSTF